MCTSKREHIVVFGKTKLEQGLAGSHDVPDNIDTAVAAFLEAEADAKVDKRSNGVCSYGEEYRESAFAVPPDMPYNRTILDA